MFESRMFGWREHLPSDLNDLDGDPEYQQRRTETSSDHKDNPPSGVIIIGYEVSS